jgi:HlyD family secretion protein
MREGGIVNAISAKARWLWVVITVCVAAAGVTAYAWVRPTVVAAAQTPDGKSNGDRPSLTSSMTVNVVHPKPGDMDRTTTQPGTVQAYELAQLYAGVSGYLKTQVVDIGDRVKAGQVLAIVDVPDLEKLVQKCTASLEQARARVKQMEARVVSANADRDAAKETVTFAEANAKSKAAELRFRQKQLERMKELWVKDHAVDERLVDEKMEQRDAALETERAAVAAIASSKAQLAAAAAKIVQTEADVTEAESEVKVAQADLEKAQVMVRFATIVAPFSGVITYRSQFPGDYVRAASESGSHTPLLTIQRTDLLRVVVQIPDRDVPYADPGDLAFVEVDALPGEKLQAKVSRIAHSEDPQTRLMHVEIDLPNPTGKICHGMYGRVKIILEKSNLLSIPSSCMVGKAENGQSAVFVVRDGKAIRTSIRVSEDNGVKVGILSGLKADDLVVRQPSSSLADEAPVAIATVDGQSAQSTRK